ncbi:MAG TPA: hypothetical protein DIU07_18085 [Rhodobacteraceae bacterium]|nr:hypothetical protein [Paracoccaceae bacterium]
MSRSIDYGNLMHDAMRGLIRDVLTGVAETGLPGAHHFFISFDTGHPDVEIADWLSDRFPDDMTVVMQHWFDDLKVDEEGFAITLNFGNQPERMYIPFDAIRTFVDPSVEFGLRFETQDSEDEAEEAADATAPEEVPMEDADDDDAKKDADVVSLDSFRK